MSTIQTVNVVYAQEGANVPLLFNQALDSTDKDLCLFIAPGVEFDEEYTIDQIKKAFSKYAEIVGVYSDFISFKDGVKQTIHYPAYSYNMRNTFNINSPICCRSDIDIRFNPNLQYLYYADFTKRLCKTHLAWHIAEPLFTLQPTEAQEDILKKELYYVANEQSS